MAGKPRYNQWWGESHKKWSALSSEGKAHGFYPDEVDRLTTNAERGAYEWLVSLGLADRWAERLGDRLLERTYSDLTAEPRAVLSDICAHFEVGTPDAWLETSASMLSPERKNAGATVTLPPAMAAQFNAYQERFGFDGRAEAK
ncbi:MAG: hypothetical protein KDA28_03620, partial [Phycisphaerales bacterium]|nr:hypothetical protein [Phycisphaerales bacterium]